ncbi:MAG: transketolase family protein [Desulfotignum sp.]|nr:transketolase family protein [Desulfotignum sp.]MCF8088690.1 transketolase family protein [Desulfotignum sp.]MCF8136420.1 transketolase family protein [Desulfotignum sp.]
MKNMRDAFGECLVELATLREDFVVLDADVAGGTGTHVFREAYPDRFIQCGIAEQNMMSVAAGISTTGLIPVVTCYAVFAAMRALDQARNSIAYPHFNVKVVVSHLGLDVGPDGPTHQCIEDLAIMRSIPNFTVISPADPVELHAAFQAILDHEGPVYFRTGRSPLPQIFESGDIRFEIGKGQVLRNGTDVTIIAVGVMVHRALNAAELLAEEGISCRVVNMSTIKPIDAGLIEESARETGCIVTAEDHNIIGGLGGAVAEVLAETYPVRLIRLGVRDVFAESGDPEELAAAYGLMPTDIYNGVRNLLSREQSR